MELWDAYNEKEEKVGIDLVRGGKIEEGLLHAVVIVIVSHIDGTYLLMQRDWNKSIYPGLWEAGASGCVLKGEDFFEASKRELLEETGIKSEYFELIDSILQLEHKTFYKVFSCICDVEKDSIVLQKGETINFKWVTSNELLDFITSKDFVTPSPNKLVEYINSKSKI